LNSVILEIRSDKKEDLDIVLNFLFLFMSLA